MKCKICIDNPFMNCEKIYSLQQKSVQKMVDSFKNNNNIKKSLFLAQV